MLKNQPTFNFLSDSTTVTDELGGGHQRIADAISDFIQNVENEGGITIGLEGKWGAGKSTIIELIKKRCPDNCYLFIFDAWAHENDPLRRIFLEQLLDYLEGKVLKSPFVKNEKSKLSGAHSKTKSTTKTSLTPSAAVGVLSSLIFIPLAWILIKKGFDLGFCLGKACGDWNLWLFFGFSFLILPVILTLISLWLWGERKISFTEFITNYLCCIARCLTTKEGWQDILEKSGSYLSKIVSNLSERGGDTKSTTDSYQTPNPTSVEFETSFRSIMEAIDQEKQGDDWKLIIVLDNLDRISADDTKRIISTFQTFLQYQQRNEKDSCYKNVWTIIPYDPEAMLKVWKGSEPTDYAYSWRMIEKRFQIRYHTPPIVPTNWKNFMLEEMEIAFPEPTIFTSERKNEFESVYFIYFLFISWWARLTKTIESDSEISCKNVIPISPRDIKIFLNQVGAIYRQWGGDVRLKHIAFYVLLRTRSPFINIAEFLKNPERQDGYSPDINYFLEKKSWMEDLAIIWFNVERTQAVPSLFEEDVLSALISGDSKALENLFSIYPSIPDIIAEQFFSGRINSGVFGKFDYFAALHAIYNSNLRGHFLISTNLLGNFFTLFRNDIHKVFDNFVAEHLVSMIKMYQEAEMLSDFRDRIQQQIHSIIFSKQPDLQVPAKIIITNWLEGLQLLTEEIDFEILEFLKITSERFPINQPNPKNTDTQLAFLDFSEDHLIFTWAHLDDITEEYYCIFDWDDKNLEYLDDCFSNIVWGPKSKVSDSSGEKLEFTAQEFHNSLKRAQKRYPNEDFKLTQKNIYETLIEFRMDIEALGNPDNIQWAFKSLEEIADTETIIELFSRKIDDANLLLAYWDRVFKSDEKRDEEFLGRILFYAFECVPTFDFEAQKIRALDTMTFVKKNLFIDPERYPRYIQGFCDRLINYGKFDTLKNNFINNPASRNWVLSVINCYLHSLRGDSQNQLPKFILQNWGEIIETCSSQIRDETVNALLELDIFSRDISIIDNSDPINDYLLFLNDVVNSPKFSKSRVSEIKNLFSSFSVAEWEEILHNNNGVKLLYDVAEKYPKTKMNENFDTAIVNHAEGIFKGNIFPNSNDYLYWDNIIGLLCSPDKHRSLILSLCERNGWNISQDSFLELYGKSLFSPVNLKTNKLLIQNLVIPQIKRDPSKTAALSSYMFEEYSKVNGKIDKKDVEDLKDILHEVLNSANQPIDDEARALLDDLFSLLKSGKLTKK